MSPKNHYLLQVIQQLTCSIRLTLVQKGLCKAQIDQTMSNMINTAQKKSFQNLQAPNQQSNQYLIKVVFELEQYLWEITTSVKEDEQYEKILCSQEQMEEEYKQRTNQKKDYEVSSTQDSSMEEHLLNSSLQQLMLRAKILKGLLNRRTSQKTTSFFGMQACLDQH